MSRRAVVSVVAVVAIAGAVVVGLLVGRTSADSPAPTADPAAAPADGGGPAAPASARPRVVSSSVPDGDERAAVESLGEAQLGGGLRHPAEHDPHRGGGGAREGNRRFPDSPYAPERTSILIHALAEQGESMKARGEA